MRWIRERSSPWLSGCRRGPTVRVLCQAPAASRSSRWVSCESSSRESGQSGGSQAATAARPKKDGQKPGPAGPGFCVRLKSMASPGTPIPGLSLRRTAGMSSPSRRRGRSCKIGPTARSGQARRHKEQSMKWLRFKHQAPPLSAPRRGIVCRSTTATCSATRWPAATACRWLMCRGWPVHTGQGHWPVEQLSGRRREKRLG